LFKIITTTISYGNNLIKKYYPVNDLRNIMQNIDAYLENMDTLFLELYREFQKQPTVARDNLPPFGGIYVFYQNERPIYVGRADNIRKRIQLHTRPSSGSESANFAFNLAKLDFIEKLSETKFGRKELMKDEDFIKAFSGHKEMLFASTIKCIRVDNDIIQTMFEPYLALKLGTYPKNNCFKNH